MLGLVGGAPHRASPIHRRRARAAYFLAPELAGAGSVGPGPPARDNAAAGGRADTETRAAAQPRAVKAWAWAARFEARMMKLEDKLDATAAGGGRAAARALVAGGGDDASPGALGRIEERLARIEETLRDVAARPSKNS